MSQFDKDVAMTLLGILCEPETKTLHMKNRKEMEEEHVKYVERAAKIYLK